MKLQEVLRISPRVCKHQDNGIYSGMHTVSKANISPGYYYNFIYDNTEMRQPGTESMHIDTLRLPIAAAGEDGWIIRK